MRRANRRLLTATLVTMLALAPTAGCNPVSALFNSVNYTFIIPLGLNGGAGLLNPLQFISLIFANITNALGLGFISPNSLSVGGSGSGGGGTPPPIFGT
ncbi:MAG: hypothetical protein U1A27_06815 [Phycisphaerae bacterium]